ncbi:hypothetical protein C0J50_0740 [Silurus asotus]|uniref:Uncharacterized protein n=1 Tax=Silurus asotus TaxID=30991 RepID=A0AAD5FE43_SILAS|nr:hypothetical protein C0J50_0740 [Silurus asotus]
MKKKKKGRKKKVEAGEVEKVDEGEGGGGGGRNMKYEKEDEEEGEGKWGMRRRRKKEEDKEKVSRKKIKKRIRRRRRRSGGEGKSEKKKEEEKEEEEKKTRMRRKMEKRRMAPGRCVGYKFVGCQKEMDKSLSEFDKGQVVMALRLGQSISEVADLVGCSESAVGGVLPDEKTIVEKKSRGRSRKNPQAHKTFLVEPSGSGSLVFKALAQKVLSSKPSLTKLPPQAATPGVPE